VGWRKFPPGFVSQLLDTLGDDPLTPEVSRSETRPAAGDVGCRPRSVLEGPAPAVSTSRWFILPRSVSSRSSCAASGANRIHPQCRACGPKRISSILAFWVGVKGRQDHHPGQAGQPGGAQRYSCLSPPPTLSAGRVQQVTVGRSAAALAGDRQPSANADPAAVVCDAIAPRGKGT